MTVQSNSSCKATTPKKEANCQTKAEKEGRELSGQVQQYMRETLKKLYLKNRREDTSGSHSSMKQS